MTTIADSLRSQARKAKEQGAQLYRRSDELMRAADALESTGMNAEVEAVDHGTPGPAE